MIFVIFFISIFVSFTSYARDCLPQPAMTCSIGEKYEVKSKEKLTDKIKTINLDEASREKLSIDVIEDIYDDEINNIYLLTVDRKSSVVSFYTTLDFNFKKFSGVIRSSNYCKFPVLAQSKMADGRTKGTTRFNVDKEYYLWQAGECSEESAKYFNSLKEKSKIRKMLKNKFILVSEDNKSQTYYANPGYIVKLEKNDKLCKKNKNCELNILLKKRLSSAILDADGKLHTDESL